MDHTKQELTGKNWMSAHYQALRKSKTLDHKTYTGLVDAKQYPDERMAPLGSRFEDERGAIQNLIENASVTSVAFISSLKGTERSQHLHKHSDHYLYLLKGKMEYYERLPDEDASTILPMIISAGMMVYTRPGVVHVTRFLEDTEMISIGSNPRTHDLHEEDLIRMNFFEKIA